MIAYNEAEVELLARLMRAEAEGDGHEGMLMVGNVGVNRVLADCLDFPDIRTLEQMVFQRPGGFEATTKGYFYQRARPEDILLARRVIAGERFHPASRCTMVFHAYRCVAQPSGMANGTQVDSSRIAFFSTYK